jgi:hypothetical protein
VLNLRNRNLYFLYWGLGVIGYYLLFLIPVYTGLGLLMDLADFAEAFPGTDNFFLIYLRLCRFASVEIILTCVLSMAVMSLSPVKYRGEPFDTE